MSLSDERALRDDPRGIPNTPSAASAAGPTTVPNPNASRTTSTPTPAATTAARISTPPGPLPAETTPIRGATISFELMPPRRPEVAPRFWETTERLLAVRPDFVSVTYGAAGTDRDTARDVVDRLRNGTPVLPIAHLTCVGHSREQVAAVVDEFLDAGVRSFLALRGDPPVDQPDWRPGPDDVHSSVELVALMREVERRRCTSHAGIALRAAVHPMTIAVATFPGGNPATGTSPAQEVERLLVKQAAGADFAITQLFYEAHVYAEFVERARAAGIHIPILAGLLPATNPRRLRRVAELSGIEAPKALVNRLDRAPTRDAQYEVGVAWTTRLARDVLAIGAPGLHIYTFNQAGPALDVVARLGLTDGVATDAAPEPDPPTDHHPHANASHTPDPSRKASHMSPSFPTATILGYPRIGPHRELKKAVESFWAGRIDEAALEHTAADLRAATRNRLLALGLDGQNAAIPESFSYYDQVLDITATVGALPSRFDGLDGLDQYFTAARGAGDIAPLEMTKWFDTNYHYLVPEIGPSTKFSLSSRRLVEEVREARSAGLVTRPVLVGPVTYLLLSKSSSDAPSDAHPLERLADLLPVYAQLLGELAAAGATWVQLDEPGLVTDNLDVPADRVQAALTEAYTTLSAAPATERPAIFVATPFGDLRTSLETLAATNVEAIGLDLVRGTVPEPARTPVPGLAEKTIVGGVIDGHNIWRADLAARLDVLEQLRALGASEVAVSTSTSLLHVPHDVAQERWADAELDARLHDWLAFADQKVDEVVTLARGLREGRDAVADDLSAATTALASRASAPGVVSPTVRARTGALTPADFTRTPTGERAAAQRTRLNLPPLPTTTIGSFPQTTQIRQARAAFGKGSLSPADYQAAMREEIGRVIALQEEIGLDVLVHGEAERNDMVQYFAELLDGFAVTQNGWVQSYGSRCTRPSILWGDVARSEPMTVAWTSYAQALTSKPVKGMLTGPVTIMAWSFVRDDIPLGETANQIALALRDEITDLEAAGIAIVQVDEPALRELLPLRREDQPDYLDWSVAAFRLATSAARPDTQVHTHLCYSEFGEVIGAIDALGADVTSIEAARSRMEILPELAAAGYSRGVGPGVYDIHSPRVPSSAEVTELVDLAARSVPRELLWVNPDCGLKTRGYQETTASLRHLVAAAHTVRDRAAETVPHI